MRQNDIDNIDQAKLEPKPRAYPTPEPTHITPRPIFPRTQPHGDRPLYFASLDSTVSPTNTDRIALTQPFRADERRAPQYGSDDAPTLYTSQPTNYTNLTAWGSLSSPPGKPELMAATAHGPMGHQPGPYHTPQSNSPASVASPHHQHVRQMYPSNIHHAQHPMYYGAYAPHQHQQYGYGATMQPPPLATHSPQYQMPSYHQGHHIQQQHPHQHHPPPPPSFEGNQPPKLMHMPAQATNPRLSSIQLSSAGGGRSSQPGQHTGPGNSQSASASAPGPIRATTPLVVKQDVNGVTTISFEYSKDRVKQPYEIRCDVESVDVKSLSQEHKNENCVYPRACSGEPYKGNRWQYENECNEVAWALAYLNPELKGKRGLIQRAVDSWRNSNRDRKLRSRRVRRMAKTEKRAAQTQQQNPNRSYGPPSVTNSSVPGPLGVSNGLEHPAAHAAVPIGPVGQYHTNPVHLEHVPPRNDVRSSGTS